MKNPLPVCVLALLCCLPLSAAQNPYTYAARVSELLGAVESPRLIHDYCVAKQSASSKDVETQYAAWRKQNRALLTGIDQEIALGRKLPAPDSASPTVAFVAEMVDTTFTEKLRQYSAEQGAQICATYGSFLKSKNLEMQNSVPALLKAATEARQAQAPTATPH
ncbi:MAG: hypothetical protein QM718_05435 [Steroidobacteraceae bacterium]